MDGIRIALLGCGTVGGGVVNLINANVANFSSRLGVPISIGHVLVRDADKGRVAALDTSLLTTEAEDVLGDPTIDVFVELMGGVDPARTYVERALESGRSVVTANKKLLALHGPSLIDHACRSGVDLAFEGAVGGGIPIVRTLREALASDSVVSICGIVNGTCNYILTAMAHDGASFKDALIEAQSEGFAEADPSLDVDGHDAAHKLVVLAMLAFGAHVLPESVLTEGIRDVEPIDHRFAARFGFIIKHVAIGKEGKGDTLDLRVHPALVPRHTTLANVNGVLNAIVVEGRALGACLLSGRGAGEMPTAVSVVADLLDVAYARRHHFSGAATRGLALRKRVIASRDEIVARYYLRFTVFDRPGVLAWITGALGERGISIEEMVQEGRGGEGRAAVQVVMLTHEANERDVMLALDAIGARGFVVSPTRMIRVL